jgi:uncharacterized protein (TIGR03067 family)
MRIPALFVIVFACGLAFAENPQTVPAEKNTAADADTATLQGTWKVTKTSGFEAKSKDELKDLKLTVKDKRLTAHYGDKTAEATFKLDAIATPRRMDVTVTDGPADVKGKTFECIYLLEGDVWHVAFRKPGEKRPSEFITRNREDLYEVWLKKAEK